MKRKMIRKYLILLVSASILCLFLIKCRKPNAISSIPHLTYLGYSKIQYMNFPTDSLIYLKFEFEDGDGNIGLNLTDTASPFRIGERYYYNIFAEYLVGKNGVYSYLINGADTVNYNDRISNLQPDTRNKSINGTITLKLESIIGAIIPDSIKLNIFLVDRALNKSNTISTGAIPVNF